MNKLSILIIIFLLISIVKIDLISGACSDINCVIEISDNVMVGTVEFSYKLTNLDSAQRTMEITEILNGYARSPVTHTLGGNEEKVISSEFTATSVGNFTIDIQIDDASCVFHKIIKVHNFSVDTWSMRKFYYPSSTDEIVVVVSCTNLGPVQDFDLEFELRDSNGTLISTWVNYTNGTDILIYSPTSLDNFTGYKKFGVKYQTDESDSIGTWKFKATMTLRSTDLKAFPKSKSDPLIDDQGYLHIHLYDPSLEIIIADMNGNQQTEFIFKDSERNDFKIIGTNLSERQIIIDFEVLIMDGNLLKWKYIKSDTYPSLMGMIFDSAGEIRSKREIIVMIPPNVSQTLILGKTYTLKVIGRIQATKISTEANANIQYEIIYPDLVRRIEVLKEGRWIEISELVSISQKEEISIRVLFINNAVPESVKLEYVGIRVIDPRNINVLLSSPAYYTNLVIPPSTAPNNFKDIIIRFMPTQGLEGIGDYKLILVDGEGKNMGPEYIFTVREIEESHVVTMSQPEYLNIIQEGQRLKVVYSLKNEGTFNEMIDITYYINGQQITALETKILKIGEELTFEYEFDTINLPVSSENYFVMILYQRSTDKDLTEGQKYTFYILPRKGRVPTGVEVTITVEPGVVYVNNTGVILIKIKNIERYMSAYDIELTGVSEAVGLGTTLVPNKIIDSMKEETIRFEFKPHSSSPPEGFIFYVYINGLYMGQGYIIVQSTLGSEPVKEQKETSGLINLGYLAIAIVVGGLFLVGLKKIRKGRGNISEDEYKRKYLEGKEET